MSTVEYYEWVLWVTAVSAFASRSSRVCECSLKDIKRCTFEIRCELCFQIRSRLPSRTHPWTQRLRSLLWRLSAAHGWKPSNPSASTTSPRPAPACLPQPISNNTNTPSRNQLLQVTLLQRRVTMVTSRVLPLRYVHVPETVETRWIEGLYPLSGSGTWQL